MDGASTQAPPRTMDRESQKSAEHKRTPQSNLRIDLGCGSVKKAGTLGVDIQEIPGVDFVVDLERSPLPFGNDTVEYVHSSHFLEHVVSPSPIFSEIARVCKDGARLEFWTPYAWSDDAFIFTHKTFFTEEHYLHMCVRYPEFYRDFLHSRWVLHEIQYVVRPEVLGELWANHTTLDYALRYFHNVAREFGVYMTVHKTGEPDIPPIRRTFSISRSTERFELRREDPTKYASTPMWEALKHFAASGPLPPVA